MTTSLTKHTPTQTGLIQTAWDALSDATKTAYDSDLKPFYAFINKPINEVTPKDIVAFRDHLRSHKYKNATINRKIASISKLFNVYVMAGALKHNPVEMARQYSKLTSKVIRSQRSSLTLQNIKDCVDARHISEADRRCAYMIKFLAKTGLRVSEMVNIEYSDISDMNDKICRIRILGKGSKERFITIDKQFIDELKSVFVNNTDLFYSAKNRKYSRKSVHRLIKERFKRTVNINVHPHSLRHFFITHKIVVEKKDIKAVSKYAGHSSSSITIDMYVDSALNSDDSFIDL